MAQNRIEPINDILRTRIVQTKDSDTHARIPAGCYDLSEVEVECQNDSLLGKRQGEDIAIGKPLQLAVAKMDRVVAGRT